MKRVVIEIISFLFILLFVYAALTKLFEYQKFAVQINQSPLLTGFGMVIAPLVIASELVSAALLAFQRYRLIAFFSCFCLMTAFTTYIIFILRFSSFIPCSCGGVLEKLGWTEHLIFNSAFVILALIAIILQASFRHSETKSFNTHPIKKILLPVISCFVLSIAGVTALYALSTDIRQTPGSFLRQYPPHPALETASMPLAYDSYYLAGVTQQHVYLGNRLAPLHVLRISSDLKDTTHITLRLPGIEHQRFRRITVRIDSPYFYLMDGVIPYYYQGLIRDCTGTNALPDTTYFIDAVPISPASFIMRTTSVKTSEHALGKKNLHESNAELNHTLLEKQVDGIFCTDGSLSYNKELNRLIYVYYYRNQYLTADTSLRLDFRANTIDTFTHAQVKFAAVQSEQAVRLAAPPVIVNRLQATYGRWLFIVSGLPAHNDDMDEFEQASVVDVYDLTTRQYRFSFYLYNKDGKRVKGLLIAHQTLYALYDNTLTRCALSPRLFPSPDI